MNLAGTIGATYWFGPIGPAIGSIPVVLVLDFIVLPVMVCRYLGVPVARYVAGRTRSGRPGGPGRRGGGARCSSTSTRRTPAWPPSWRRWSPVAWPGRCSHCSWRGSSRSSVQRCGSRLVAAPDRPGLAMAVTTVMSPAAVLGVDGGGG